MGSNWTYVDDALSVAHEKVPEQAGLIQVPEPDHVVHAFHGRRVHGSQRGLILLGEFVHLEGRRGGDAVKAPPGPPFVEWGAGTRLGPYLPLIVNQLPLPGVRQLESSSDRNAIAGLQPDEIALRGMKRHSLRTGTRPRHTAPCQLTAHG